MGSRGARPAEQGARFPGLFRWVSLGLVSFVVLVVVAGVSLTLRGREAMAASDIAFHQGKNHDAVVQARKAALCYVPGSAHVRAAHDRLEAIARGAEAEGEVDLARFAWSTLRLVHLQTHYPGRLAPEGLAKAEAGIERLKER